MKKIIKSILIGFISGIISGFFGAGGGLLLVPFLKFILKENEVKSRATTIFCVFFMVFTSSIFYFKESYISFSIGLRCMLGGIIGGYIGTKLLTNLNSKILEITFIIFLIYTSIKMIF